ncbi:MAG: undecaprenyldiphospho-muramoylpentapeptide beta-N-acetylglucosaminyltransferase [Akkermansiaceae bacterium]|nr:undecaprenyldiphospho-muramoylpentapeptide beta-N-acetylglucosaminyltransferase [Akkermansiaceae bacterium]
MPSAASPPLKILIACGGTGGHLFPGIAVAEALIAKGHQAKLLISQKKVDADATAKYAHLEFETLPAVAKPPTLSPRMLPFLLKTWQSIRRCKAILQDFEADAVIGMGGFTSLPPVVAGQRLGLKTFIHDSNARPGRANLLTSRWCSKVFLGFEAARAYFPQRPTEITGTPVRPEILDLPSREEAAASFGLDPHRKTILVTGGSQGARRLNDICAETAAQLPEGVQMLHVAGTSDGERVAAMAEGRSHHKVLGFCDRMPAAYACADLIITRSGASSLTEISAVGLPSILVPYPYAADDHQTRNAEVFASVGAARLAREDALNPELLLSLIQSIFEDLHGGRNMSQAARSLAVLDAAQRVCDAIISTLKPS